MTRWILPLGVWLLGTVAAPTALAFDAAKPETLRYGVFWGPLRAGNAQLDYALKPPQLYSLTVRVWDTTPLLDLDDTWKTSGHHATANIFIPARYEAQQRENDYRADKLVLFDPSQKIITYTNHRDASDNEPPLPWKNNMRDALSAVYAWRVGGVSEIQRGGTLDVMGLKRPFTLNKAAGVRETLAHDGKNIQVWRVNMTTAVNGKPSKDSWIIRLRDDATLTPVEIVAVTKFGTFKAILEE